MGNGDLQFINVDDTKIAVRLRKGKKVPGLVWLGGYRSDMLGTKAAYLDDFAAHSDLSMLRHDYSGHGESGGDFFQGTISQWLKQSLTVFDDFATGPQILVGSSMGGWIALRMAQELKKRGIELAGMILLAPAPDFTATLVEPNLTEKERHSLDTKGFFEVESEFGIEPYSKALIDDGKNNIVMTRLIDPGCPVHIIQGMQDQSVPYQHTMTLMEHLPLNDVTLTLVHDGDHRLSRPQDLALLGRTVEGFLAGS